MTPLSPPSSDRRFHCFSQSSTDLREWLTLAVLTDSVGTTALFDGTATNAPAYFYRAKQGP